MFKLEPNDELCNYDAPNMASTAAMANIDNADAAKMIEVITNRENPLGRMLGQPFMGQQIKTALTGKIRQVKS